MKTKIAINGACGRMGQRLVALAKEDPDLQVIAAVDWAKHPNQGKDAGELAGIGPIGIKVTGTLPADLSPDSVIDFSTPEGTTAILAACGKRKLPLVVATTGHTHAQREEIEAAAHQTAILFTANFSLVVNEITNDKVGPEEFTRLVETKVAAIINHSCFPNPLPIMGVRKGQFTQDYSPILLFRYRDGWSIEKVVHN